MASDQIVKRKYSGISYIFDPAGVEIPQKFTTISALDYPLLDSKNIDWNDSYLSNIERIDFRKIIDFLGGENRERYADDPNYESVVDKTTLPEWLANRRLKYSAEVLDLIDYLLSRCIYLDDKVDELEENINKRRVDLIFDENEIHDLKSALDNNGNIYLNIVYTVKPNQTNPDFIGTQYESDERSFTLSVYTKESIQELDLFYGSKHGIQINNEISAVGTGGGIVSILGAEEVQISKITPEVGIFWLLKFDMLGWTPTSFSDPDLHYPDEIFNAVIIQTPPNDRYNASESRYIPIMVKKDANPFDYLFINNERYFYIPSGTFSSFNTHSKLHDHLIISEYNLKLLFGDNYSTDFANYTDDQVQLMSPYFLGDPNNPYANMMIIPDDSDIDIKVYPKYFGVSDAATKYCGSTDIYTGDSDKPSVGDIQFNVLNMTGENAGKNVEVIESGQSQLPRNEFGDREYEGFSWKGSFKRKDKKIHDNEQNSLRLTITTSATYYVAKNELNIGISVSSKRNVKFVDRNYNLDDDKNHTTIIDSNDRPMVVYGEYRDFITSKLDQSTNEWDLTFPIWSESSWKNKADINDEELTLGERIKYPDSDYELKDTTGDYSYGFPMINLNYSLTNTEPMYKPLIGALVQGDDDNWYDVTDSFVIDYESTFIENSVETQNKFITDWDSQIGWDNYSADLTLEDRGKILCDHFVRLNQEVHNGLNKGKWLQSIHTTFTTPTEDNFENYDDIPTFKLILKIPENSTQSEASNLPIYNEAKLTVNIYCTRAINSEENNFTGWAKLISPTTGEVKHKSLQIGKEVSFSEIVSSNAFTTESDHTIQTRSLSNFVVDMSYVDTQNVNGSDYTYFTNTINGVVEKIYFRYNDVTNKITFLSAPNESMDNIYWQFNHPLHVQLPGIQLADYFVEKYYTKLDLIVNRQSNDFVRFKSTEEIVKNMTSEDGIGKFMNCMSIDNDIDIIPIGGLSGTDSFNGQILNLTAHKFKAGSKIYLADLMTGIAKETTNDDGDLDIIYGPNWKINNKYRCIITVQHGENQPKFWLDRPNEMSDIVMNPKYGVVYDDLGNVTDLPVEKLIEFDNVNAVLNFQSDNFAGYTEDAYVCIDILFPMTTTYRGLCMKILLKIAR